MAKAVDFVMGPGPDGVRIQFTAANGSKLDVDVPPELACKMAMTLVQAATQVKELHPILLMFQIDQIQGGVVDGVPTLTYTPGHGDSVTVTLTESDFRQVMEAWATIDPASQQAARSVH